MTSTGRRALAAIVVLVPVTTAGCGQPEYMPLPLPVAQTRGATPVPANGVGMGFEFGDGLTGRGLVRKELVHAYVTAGIDDRASFSVGGYGGLENYDPGGTLLGAKVRLGALLGDRTSTAARLGLAFTGRNEESQDDAMTVVDVALPTEWLAGRTGESTFYSFYGGPRLLYQDYRDDVQPETSFSDVLPGALGGAHLAFGHFHVFGEATVAWLPDRSGGAVPGDGGATFLPSGAVVAHFGSPFGWDR